jgi:undecaprenyl diphosphate synthase
MTNEDPKHVAIILDGNGRWATAQGKSRTEGHVEGARTLKKVVQTFNKKSLKVLSIFTFSTENWQRPKSEVAFLMNLPKRFKKDIDELAAQEDGIRVLFSGRKDRLSKENLKLIEHFESSSQHNTGLIVNVCLDYGFKDEMVHVVQSALKAVSENHLDANNLTPEHLEKYLYQPDLPPIDLLIRTGGEKRLSNFMLWQAAYAEIYFTDYYWPEFNPALIEEAYHFYHSRDRRFGKVNDA